MEYKIIKGVIHAPSAYGLFQCPLKRGIGAHYFARKYTSLLSGAIEGAATKDFKGIVSSLFSVIDLEELDDIVAEVFEGLTLNGEVVNTNEVHFPIELTFSLLLAILHANCKPLLGSKYKPPSLVTRIQAKAKASNPSRSLENVSTSSLGEIKLLILSLACSEFNGNHDYRYFMEDCPLSYFYDLLEYRTIRTSVEAENIHYQKEAQKRK
ncbi:hypothetical protein [Aeromonas sanarellii]|uniref:hypothetical protein n=1 Tax=Aeromonas sanarellii TaxID=633415 RepID=UPI0038D0E548